MDGTDCMVNHESAKNSHLMGHFDMGQVMKVDLSCYHLIAKPGNKNLLDLTHIMFYGQGTLSQWIKCKTAVAAVGFTVDYHSLVLEDNNHKKSLCVVSAEPLICSVSQNKHAAKTLMTFSNILIWNNKGWFWYTKVQVIWEYSCV